MRPTAFDGPDNSPLILVPGTAVEIGVLMDYASAGQGTIDEVRIDGSELVTDGFLLPEPSSGVLLGLGLVALGMGRRSHARARRTLLSATLPSA